MVDDLIISVLKKHITPSDYDLHDWNTIIERREQFKDGVYSYPCIYANILLTDDLEFYDAEPKQPIHDNVIMSNLSEDEKLIISVLKKYIPYEYREDADLVTILSRREQVKKGVYKYKVNNIIFYLDDELMPVEYGKVHIINNKIYYDFDLDPKTQYAPLIYFSDL